MYFPNINFGIEVDEEHHKNHKEADIKRFEEIYSNMSNQKKFQFSQNAISGETPDYKEERITCYGVSFEQLEQQIDDVVLKIKSKIKSKKIEWYVDYQKQVDSLTEQVLKVGDNIVFPTIDTIVNSLYKGDLKKYGVRKGTYRTQIFNEVPELDNHILWFPRLAVEENGKFKAKGDWNNQLVDDYIREYNESKPLENKNTKNNNGTNKEPNYRITFARTENLLGEKGYQFIGIFEKISSEIESKAGTKYYVSEYKRISDQVRIYPK